MPVSIGSHGIEAVDHDFLETLVYRSYVPKVAHSVLDPFEIGNGDPSGIRQNIRDNEYFFVEENVIGLGCRGTIGALANNLGFDAAGIFAGDLIFRGRRKQDVAFLFQQVLPIDGVGIRKSTTVLFS